MQAIVTGGTGVIGRVLVKTLVERGHEVAVLSRNPEGKARLFPKEVRIHRWNGHTVEKWAELITEDTAIINLAGEPIAHWRWTEAHKRRVLHSRLSTSRAVLLAVKAARQKPRAVLQASAVGYYGPRGDETLSEASPPGDGWRADVVKEWESVTDDLGVRRVLLRIGIVLDLAGGALPAMLLGARFMGGQLGDGRQWVPWIHNLDVALATAHLMEHPDAEGAYNLVAPEPVTNRALMQAIGAVIGWPTFIPVPAFALNTALGEMASSVLDSQRVYPPRLLQSGYSFRYPDIKNALHDLLGRSGA